MLTIIALSVSMEASAVQVTETSSHTVPLSYACPTGVYAVVNFNKGAV